jgi:hypothetical protein
MKTLEDLFPKKKRRVAPSHILHKDTTWYSLKEIFLKEGKINEDFLICLSQLSLEDLIALKLEISSRFPNKMKNRLFGLPFWTSLGYIAKDAALKWAVSAGIEARHNNKTPEIIPTPEKILGMNKDVFYYYLSLFGIDRNIEYFYQKHYLQYLKESEKSLFYSFKKNEDIIKELPKTDD